MIVVKLSFGSHGANVGGTSGFRARFQTDSNRESLTIATPAGRRPAGWAIRRHSQLESGRNPPRKTDCRPGSCIVYVLGVLKSASSSHSALLW